jgi:hypothetical protein
MLLSMAFSEPTVIFNSLILLDRLYLPFHWTTLCGINTLTPFGFPGALVLTSRQVSNPIFSSDMVCQTFLAPSPTNLIASYSELAAHGKGFMESKYFSLESATFLQVFSNEVFSFDSELKTAFSQTNTFVLGNGTANHYIATSVNFRYTPITMVDANTLGWNNGDVSNVTSGRGFHAGRGAVPHTILSVAQRTQLGL